MRVGYVGIMTGIHLAKLYFKEVVIYCKTFYLRLLLLLLWKTKKVILKIITSILN